MDMSYIESKWMQLIQSIDDGIRTLALNANVSHEELQSRYIMACLHITKPFEYSNKYNNVKQKVDASKAGTLSSSAATKCKNNMEFRNNFEGHKNDNTCKKMLPSNCIAAGDNTTAQEKGISQMKINQNASNGCNRVSFNLIHSQQHQQFPGGNQKTIVRQRPQQSYYSRTVRGSSVPPYRTPINCAGHGHQANAANNGRFGAPRNNCNNSNAAQMTKASQPKTAQQPKDARVKKMTKFYCDIEAALTGEISDVDDDEELPATRFPTVSKPLNGNDKLCTSASLAEETISLVEAQLKNARHPQTRIVRYPNGKPLALNVIHKIYVIELEGAYAWVRLCDGDHPPCFDAAHVMMKAAKALEWEELLPGTPCVVFARFNPLDVTNDGITRELTEFESYARAVVEEYHGATKSVTVRLVDFGYRLPHLAVAEIKPLTIAFDGPPLAIRLHIDQLPKQQKESVSRYSTLCVRLTVAREKHFLCWSRTWKAIDVQRQNWNEDSDCSSSLHSADLRCHHCASSEFGSVARAFVSSWLNKDHKRAGGPGIQAALCGIAKRRADLPPSEFAIKPANDDSDEKLSLQSTQISDESVHTALDATEKMDEEWPALGEIPKSPNKKPQLSMTKKECNIKKEKKWCIPEAESSTGSETHSHQLTRSCSTAVEMETAKEFSITPKASSSMTTVYTCQSSF